MSTCSRLPPISSWLCISSLLAACVFGCEDDSTRFGPPGGLRVRGNDQTNNSQPCPLPEGVSGDPCPDWATEVFPLFDGKYGCTLDNCHSGSVGAASLTLYEGDASASYDAMAAYDNYGRKYFEENGQDSAYLMCNLSNDPQINFLLSSPMPILTEEVTSLVVGEDLILVGNWVACGMLKQGGGGGQGGSGGGGS